MELVNVTYLNIITKQQIPVKFVTTNVILVMVLILVPSVKLVKEGLYKPLIVVVNLDILKILTKILTV